MPRTPAEGRADLARLAGSFVAAVAEQEAQMLHLMQAELGVLAKPRTRPAPGAAARTEAETEASFDNMPI